MSATRCKSSHLFRLSSCADCLEIIRAEKAKREIAVYDAEVARGRNGDRKWL